jgi:serine protease AprX
MTARTRSWIPALVAGIVALATFGVAPVTAHAPGDRVAVIVSATSIDVARDAVDDAGGAVTRELALVGGVAAVVDSRAVGALDARPDIQVVPDATLEPVDASFPATGSAQLGALDPGPRWTLDSGAGVGVALVDTGVADTPDLTGDRLVRGPDLSDEGDGVDRYGHGTFMAGLIAGDGTASADEVVRHTGVAPGATVVSVKVAGASGETTVSRVIAAIAWVIDHRAEHNLRVLNLSFGVDTELPLAADPLAAAVEAAWAHGITVVAAAGNDGPDTVPSPGADPWIVTVGATDTAGTPAVTDDAVADWSGREAFKRYAKPEVSAPGVSVVSLRAPGSTVDAENPEARVDDAYFRGTGTSMSTALVSGVAAVLVEHHPAATPDDLKGALVDGAVAVAGANAVSLARSDVAEPDVGWAQRYPAVGQAKGKAVRMPWADEDWAMTRWRMTRWRDDSWTMTRWRGEYWDMTRWRMTRWRADVWDMTRWRMTRWRAEAWSSDAWS